MQDLAHLEANVNQFKPKTDQEFVIYYDQGKMFQTLLKMVKVGFTQDSSAQSAQIGESPSESEYLFQLQQRCKKLLVYNILEKSKTQI